MDARPPSPDAVRRCPNCGTRVAQQAEICYFCGHPLDERARRRPVRLLDLGLVLLALLVILAWWQFGGRTTAGDNAAGDALHADEAEGQATIQVTAGQPMTETVATAVAATLQEPLPIPQEWVHRVQPGETLLAIATRYGVPVEAIREANGLSGDLIRAGDELRIPLPRSVLQSQDTFAVPTVFRYTVQPGDTLVGLAIRFGTQVDAILAANDLASPDLIRPGQVLQVPVDQVPAQVLASAEAARAQQEQTPSLYPAPRLLTPTADAVIPRSEDVLFTWLSVDLLAENEWYVWRAWPVQGASVTPPAVWTKSTGHRLGREFAPRPGAQVIYAWQVSVVRVLPDRGQGREIQLASQPGEIRRFIWQ